MAWTHLYFTTSASAVYPLGSGSWSGLHPAPLLADASVHGWDGGHRRHQPIGDPISGGCHLTRCLPEPEGPRSDLAAVGLWCNAFRMAPLADGCGVFVWRHLHGTRIQFGLALSLSPSSGLDLYCRSE